MAFTTWDYVIIYNDGSQSKGSFGAGSYAEAYSKVKATASISASAHKGIADIIVSER